MLKSFTKSLKSSSNPNNVPILVNPKVVGGGADQQVLFNQLSIGNSLQVRAAAALKMLDNLEKYAISSIPEIWYAARDLCEVKSSAIRRSVVQLLVRCIEQDQALSTSVKLVYYQDIVRYCRNSDVSVDPDTDLFVRALVELTIDGRDVYDLIMYNGDQNLLLFLNRTLGSLGVAYERATTPFTTTRHLVSSVITSLSTISHGTSNASRGDTLTPITCDIVAFTENCLKFNFNLVDEDLLISIVTNVLSLGVRSCSLQSDPVSELVMNLVHSVVMYGHIPPNSMFQSIEFICGCFLICPDLAWETISKLDSGPTKLLTTSALCDVLCSDSLRADKLALSFAVQSCVGSIQLLEKIHLANCLENKSDFEYVHSKVLESSLASLAHNIPILVDTYLTSLIRLFLNTEVFEKLFPFLVWHSSTLSVFEVLKAMVVSSQHERELWTRMCDCLLDQYQTQHSLRTPRGKLVDLFLYHPHYISEQVTLFVINVYSEEKLCNLLANPMWKENSFRLLNVFYGSEMTNTATKIHTLSVIKEALAVPVETSSLEVFLDVLFKSTCIKSAEVLQYFLEMFVQHVHISLLVSDYTEVVQIFKDGLPKLVTTAAVFANSLIKAFCEVFLVCAVSEPAKAQITYNLLTYICEKFSLAEHNEMLLNISRCLVRLRCTNDGFYYFTSPTDMDGLATAVGRNINEPNYVHSEIYGWVHPEKLDFLPELYFDTPGKKLITCLPTNSRQQQVHFAEPLYVLEISKWIEIVISFVSSFVHWEIYTFIWAHFCPQLANMKLFDGHQVQIGKLRQIVCDSLSLSLPATIQIPNRITKSDLQVMFVRTMSALIGYHTTFTKQNEDQIILSLIFGLGSWEKTAIPCIHILTVCCYEIPLSVKKYLSLILSKLQVRISSSLAASPTLEFLLSLSGLETMTTNFTLDEFKRVFAIAFQYIQHCNERRNNSKEESDISIQMHGIDADVDQTPSTSTQNSSILSQYVLALSYQVISNWYLKLALSERKLLSGFLIKNLLGSSSSQNPEDHDETMAYIDLVSRFTYSDLELEIWQPSKRISDNNSGGTFGGNIQLSGNSQVSTNSWIIGATIISISTNCITGESDVITRRPTGATNIKIIVNDPELAFNKAAEMQGSSMAKPLVSANHLLLHLYNNLDTHNQSKPIPLIEDPITMRAIAAFDRIPTIEFHKIGLVYIGPNQTQESEILANIAGSRAYQDFLANIGTLVRLENCKEVYVGGLDTESGSDGEFAIFWKSKIGQLIFHTTTMMPNNENDKRLEMKKRHIGNDYVNIYYDELGLPFNFNVIRSQFNFVNIVISPHSINSAAFPVTRANANAGGNTRISSNANSFKVKIYRRAGVPGVFACCHFKIISQEQLPVFIKNLATICDQFASVWHTHGEYTTNWAHRYNQIKVLRQKTTSNHDTLKQEQEKAQGGVGNFGVGGGNGSTNSDKTKKVIGVNTAQSFLEQLRDVPVSNLSSIDSKKFEYVGREDSLLYSALEFNSFT